MLTEIWYQVEDNIELGSKVMLKAKTFKDLHLDLDHSISDDNDGDYENNLRRAGCWQGDQQ